VCAHYKRQTLVLWERWTIDDLVVAGDKVVVRGRGESTHGGGWHGIPATGQRVIESCITIFRINRGKIREMWFEVSDLHVAYQLGAFPPRETRRDGRSGEAIGPADGSDR